MLTDNQIADARALWQEHGRRDLTLAIVSRHVPQPAIMDPDRPLGALVSARQTVTLVASSDPLTIVATIESLPDPVSIRRAVLNLATVTRR